MRLCDANCEKCSGVACSKCMVGMFPRAWEGASTARGSRTTPSVRRTRRSAHGARATCSRLPGAFAHRAVARGASRAPTSPRRAWRPAGALPVGCVVIKVQRDLFVVQSERVSSAPTGLRCRVKVCGVSPRSAQRDLTMWRAVARSRAGSRSPHRSSPSSFCLQPCSPDVSQC